MLADKPVLLKPTYTSPWVPDADTVHEELHNLPWERRLDAPRSECFISDSTDVYTYGRGRGQRTYIPHPWTLDLLLLRKDLRLRLGTDFNVCFLNRYHNGSDHLGWHADDSPEMDSSRPIAVVSFGASRIIEFRRKPSEEFSKAKAEYAVLLAHGSLLVMPAGMQEEQQHRIPKSGSSRNERISLTFRVYKKP